MPSNRPKPKTGRLNKRELQYIEANAGRMHPKAIAGYLNRSDALILKALTTCSKGAGAAAATEHATEQDAILAGLHMSASFAQLKTELTPDELAFFQEEYVSYCRQFKEDLFHTERAQIIKAIKYDIYMQRNGAKQRRLLEIVGRLDRSIDAIHMQYDDLAKLTEGERAKCLMWGKEMAEANKNIGELTVEFTKLEEKQQRLMNDLKGTRQQRVTSMESAAQDFLGLIKALTQADRREMEDRQSEQARGAMEKERTRLSQPHKFADGVIDTPLMTPETILADLATPA